MLSLSSHRQGSDDNPTSCPLHPDCNEAALLQTITSFSPALPRGTIGAILFTTPVTRWAQCLPIYFSPQLGVPCQKRSKNCVLFSRLIPCPWKDLGKMISWRPAWDAIINSDCISLQFVHLSEVHVWWCAAHLCWQILSGFFVFSKNFWRQHSLFCELGHLSVWVYNMRSERYFRWTSSKFSVNAMFYLLLFLLKVLEILLKYKGRK